MRQNLLLKLLLLSLVGGATTAHAQVSASSADAAQACRQARLRQGQETAAVSAVSVRHRQKMDRYDVKFYQLDLTLDNTSR
ncbi:MAG: hypothetical protein EOO62_36905, partial [Hymenobacter sp.]